MFSASKIAAPTSSGYNLTRSLRFRASASAYLSKSYSASATNPNIQTISVWTKRGQLGTIPILFMGYSNASNLCYYAFNSDDTLWFVYTSAGTQYILKTSQVFRDASAWYHLVFAYDSTQATAANRVKLYVNGVQITSFSAAAYPPQNNNSFLYTVSGLTSSIGSFNGTSNWYDGYMAELNFVDGQALTPSSFGSTNSTTGVWQPAKYTGTYGTNGFYLPFTDNSALTTSSNVGLGKDFSGNGNYWTTNNISITAGVTYDSMTDVPTLTSATAANFCVMNAVAPYGSYLTLTEANLKSTCNGAYWAASPATIGVSSGKWYWEVTASNLSGSLMVGITKDTDIGATTGANVYPGISANSYGYIASGTKYNNNASTGYGAAYTTNDVIGVALNMDAGTLTFYKNNTSQGTAFSSLSGTYLPSLGVNSSPSAFIANFGQRPFAYSPPTGFVALNTYNLPTNTIVKGNTVMDATTYTGTLLSNTITNAAGFKPDLVWLKSRSATTDHKLTDSVRGTTKGLVSDSTAAETTDAQGLTAFNSNGFTVGTDTTYNNLAATYVAWQWQAGQGSSSSNTNGTITSTVSVNASAGFSVVTYTGTGTNGATVGHGLGVAPAFLVTKSRNNGSTSWQVYHQSLGATYLAGYLDSTAAAFASATYWNNTAPTSNVFSLGTSSYANVSGQTQVAYCWTPIAGFSAFGNISANGAADNAFVYTGFLPRFVLLKRTDSTSNWYIWDTARNTFNVFGNELYPNLSNAEASATDLDVLSNGFKLRNSSFSGTWIYAAFASNPFKNSLAF